MENAWNEYLKLESDVAQLKHTLQEQHRRAFFFQVAQGLSLRPGPLIPWETPTQGLLSSPGAQPAHLPKVSLWDPSPGKAVMPSLPTVPASLLLDRFWGVFCKGFTFGKSAPRGDKCQP